jgi:Flp pilus assembly protein TadG
MLIRLSKRVLDQIYYNNKAKLCEIRIRLMGTNVDLLHAIDHPRGGELFLEYLTRERAAENLLFYRAVDKYDAMCKDVRKQYAHIQKVRQLQAEEEAEASLAELAENCTVMAEGQLTVRATGESSPTSPQPRTPEASSPGQASPDNRSAYENSMKQSPPKRLDPIMSASNFDPSSKSGDGSARAGPIMDGSERDMPRDFAVKVKPPVRGQQPRQSSFSGRVALALTEDEIDDKTDLSDNDAATALTTAPLGATVQPDSALGTEKLTHSASAIKVSEEVDSPKDAAAIAAMLVTDHSAATVQTTATENTLGARKSRHRSSFLQAKAENMERAHEFYDRQDQAGKGAANAVEADEGTGGKGSSTDVPSLAVLRSRTAKKIVRLMNTLRTQVLELNEVARVIMQTYIYNDASQQLNLPEAMRIRCERQFSQWCTDLTRAPKGDISTLPSTDALDQLPSSTGVTPKGYASTQASFSAPVNKLNAHHGSMHSTYFRNAYGPFSAADLHSPSEDTFQTANSSTVQLENSTHSSPHVGYQLAAPTPLPSGGLARPESMNIAGIASSGKLVAAAQSEAKDTPAQQQQPPQQLGILSPHTAAAMSAVDIDLSFIDLFKEIKNEILKLLRDDKFPRWKATQEFQKFIASIKPYDNTTVSPAFFDTRQRLKERNLDRQASFESAGGSA